MLTLQDMNSPEILNHVFDQLDEQETAFLLRLFVAPGIVIEQKEINTEYFVHLLDLSKLNDVPYSYVIIAEVKNSLFFKRFKTYLEALKMFNSFQKPAL